MCNAGTTETCTDAWDLGYTTAQRPFQGSSTADAREQTDNAAEDADWAAAESKGNRDENDDSADGEDALSKHEQENAESAGTSTVKRAILTDDVLEVCEGDSICERLSNVDNSLAGSSFQDIQDLLDSLHVAPGRPGVWG